MAARHAALAALRERDREGLDLDQAAVVVGCSRTAAAMCLHRVRKRLRHLGADDPRAITYEGIIA